MGACRSCGAEVNRTYVADRLLDRLAKSEKKGTPKQTSGECAKAGIRLPAASIRTWIRQKRSPPTHTGMSPYAISCRCCATGQTDNDIDGPILHHGRVGPLICRSCKRLRDERDLYLGH